MSEQESEIFHGDRPPEQGEKVKPSPAKSKPHTIESKADPLPASNEAPVTDEPSGDDTDHLAAAEIQSAKPSAASTPAEAEYHFEIDPESLWTMPPAMQERMSGLASFAAATNQRLDEQEKVTAKLIKSLKQLA